MNYPDLNTYGNGETRHYTPKIQHADNHYDDDQWNPTNTQEALRKDDNLNVYDQGNFKGMAE